MPIIKVQVRADPATGRLLVNDFRLKDKKLEISTQIDENPDSKTTIVWDLQLDVHEGSFNPPSADPATSGFSWSEDVPRAGIFGSPKRSRDTRITISDWHQARRTRGEWPYTLRAEVDKVPCTTDSLNKKPGDPKIENR